jgi:hypothetical protein
MLPTTTIKPNAATTTIITTTIILNPPIPSFPPPYHPSVDLPPPLLCLALTYFLRSGAPSECDLFYPYLLTHLPPDISDLVAKPPHAVLTS